MRLGSNNDNDWNLGGAIRRLFCYQSHCCIRKGESCNNNNVSGLCCKWFKFLGFQKKGLSPVVGSSGRLSTLSREVVGLSLLRSP